MRSIICSFAACALLAAWGVLGVSAVDAALTSNGLYPNGLYPNGLPLQGADLGQTFSIESVVLGDGSVITPASK